MSKIVLITGASSGLGKAIAEHLSKKGYRVYGTSRNSRKYDMPFAMVDMDVTDDASINSAVKKIMEQEGRIDILINNAGVSMAAPLEMVALEDVRQLFDTNVYGALRVSRAVLPSMRTSGSGMIINVSSIAGTIALPFRGVYCASKAALDILSETLRMEVKPFGIEVCTIPAGDMQTPIKDNWIGTYRGQDAVYGPDYRKVTAGVEANNNNGMPPEAVAEKIEKLIGRSRLPGKKIMAKPLQRLAIPIKRILPGRWFEKIIMRHSNL